MRYLVCVLLLAGCIESGADPTPAEDPVEPPIEAPTWAVGDWWTYTLGGDRVTWIVTEDLGQAWRVDIDDADWAFGHALEPVSTIGEVSKGLDGSQAAGAVHFFDFPLTQNKTWDLLWDGITWQAEVTDVVDGTAEVKATSEAGTRVYIYDNATKWFRSVTALDPNGTQLFGVELERSGGSYSGAYYRWTLHSVETFSYRPGDAVLDRFDVPEETTDIWYEVSWECRPDGIEGDQGAGALEVHPGEGEGGLSYQEVCPIAFVEQDVLDPVPGEWGITAMSAGAAINATFIPRTLEEYNL